ncbi:MAG TPA: hypothetical protein VE546_17415 [Streptomyces sp.]|uniref:hypothetical protein n=1 Tax=Streptomyces sp. TaxID=1931 RepID=UPI002D48815C|nr:hypothetical protein [Streptomyces sp.]HZG05321.1 hypothetical protein [Streptomyces sp.]
MDQLVAAAGAALVAAMATDAWQQARSAAVGLWRRVHPERVPAIEGELAEVREEVLTARRNRDAEAEEELAVDWRRRLERLVKADPALAQELRRVLDQELAPLLPRSDPSAPGSMTLTVHTGDNSQANVAGTGDITINTIHR